MLHCPCNTYDIRTSDGTKYVVNRYYNQNANVYGGKEYVDVIVYPRYMADMDDLPHSHRQEIGEFMADKPVKL